VHQCKRMNALRLTTEAHFDVYHMCIHSVATNYVFKPKHAAWHSQWHHASLNPCYVSNMAHAYVVSTQHTTNNHPSRQAAVAAVPCMSEITREHIPSVHKLCVLATVLQDAVPIGGTSSQLMLTAETRDGHKGPLLFINMPLRPKTPAIAQGMHCMPVMYGPYMPMLQHTSADTTPTSSTVWYQMKKHRDALHDRRASETT